MKEGMERGGERRYSEEGARKEAQEMRGIVQMDGPKPERSSYEGADTIVELKKLKNVEGARNIEDLYEIIKGFENVPGTEAQTPQEVVDRIEAVRNGQEKIEAVTRQYGIRQKVAKLLVSDPKHLSSF